MCLARNLQTEIPPDFQYFSIEKHLFATGPDSTAEWLVRNTSQKSIIAMQLTLEYYGENEERLGNVIGGIIAKQIAEPQSFEILKRMTDGSTAEIANILQPGDATSVGGGGTFTTLGCPSRAKLTAALLWFSDGTSFDWSAPGARLDARPDELSLSKLPGCLLRHGRRSLYLTLELNREGRIASVERATDSTSQGGACNTGEISKWVFRPALQDGKPIATSIPILLRVHDASELPRDTWDHVSPEEIPHSLVVVDALPPARGKSVWRVFFGGEPPDNPRDWGK